MPVRGNRQQEFYGNKLLSIGMPLRASIQNAPAILG